MPDRSRISAEIDAFQMTPLNIAQRRRAALTVCASMNSSGRTPEQIRTVLAALGLLPPSESE